MDDTGVVQLDWIDDFLVDVLIQTTRAMTVVAEPDAMEIVLRVFFLLCPFNAHSFMIHQANRCNAGLGPF